MSVQRRFARNQMKQRQGNSKIQKPWKRSQIRTCGYRKWRTMRVACGPANRHASTLQDN